MNVKNNKFDIRQRSYQFSLDIINLTDKLPRKRCSWIISDQLLRSATSIDANLIEARSSSSRREFKKYYEISLKSTNETIYWLNLLRDNKLMDKRVVNVLEQEAVELGKMIGSAVIKLKNNL